MEPATLTTRTLNIDGMSGDACVNKVTGALKDVQGVTTQSVKVGSAVIGADNHGCTAACNAIGSAGFKAHESKIAAATNGSDHKIGSHTDKPGHTSHTAGQPDMTKHDGAKHDGAKHDGMKPDATKPDASKPEIKIPSNGAPLSPNKTH